MTEVRIEVSKYTSATKTEEASRTVYGNPTAQEGMKVVPIYVGLSGLS